MDRDRTRQTLYRLRPMSLPSSRDPVLTAALISLLAACGSPPLPADASAPPGDGTAAPAPVDAAATTGGALPEERHLGDLTQLTFGGENAEAYWSFAGDQLILQARIGDAQ